MFVTLRWLLPPAPVMVHWCVQLAGQQASTPWPWRLGAASAARAKKPLNRPACSAPLGRPLATHRIKGQPPAPSSPALARDRAFGLQQRHIDNK